MKSKMKNFNSPVALITHFPILIKSQETVLNSIQRYLSSHSVILINKKISSSNKAIFRHLTKNRINLNQFRIIQLMKIKI
jgi:hypothetical protein